MRRVFGINNGSLDRKDILIFIIGLFSLVKVRVLGTLSVSELMCFGLYFLVANPFRGLKNKRVAQFFFASLLWLLGVFISDRYNDTNTVDSLKGFFNVFLVLSLIPIVFWALYDKPHRMIYYWAGNSLSSLFHYYFQKTEILSDEFAAEVWGVYAYYPIFIFIAGWFYFMGKKKLAYCIAELFAIWSLFHASRNIFLSITLSVSLMIFIDTIAKVNQKDLIASYKRSWPKIIFVIIVAFLVVKIGYEELASRKILGEYAYTKYMTQKRSQIGLASGRGDFLKSLYAIKSNPIWGYGSYAKYSKEAFQGFDLIKEKKGSNPIMMPRHSYILGAWVFSGILSLFFWLYSLKTIFVFLKIGLIYERRLIGINLLLTFSMLWNIFFSPFSNRLDLLFYMILLMILIENNDKNVIRMCD